MKKTFSVGILSDNVNCNFSAWTQWIATGLTAEEAAVVYYEELDRDIAGRSILIEED